MKKKIIWLIVLLFASGRLSLGKERFDDLPIYNQIELIFTTITYNKNLVDNLKPDTSLKVGLFFNSTQNSLKYKDVFVSIFKKEFKNKTFCDHPIELEVVDNIKKIETSNYHLLIIAPDVDQYINEILEITARKKIISATGVSKFLNSGITIIVGHNGEKRVLAINMESSKRENCRFNATILRLALKVGNNG